MNNEKTESKQKSLTVRLSKDTLTLIVLVALVVISGVQTVKLGTLKASSAGATAVPVSSGSAGSSLPASLQNLPSQVGGC